jgi:putative tryptophan/tyrosine transport system substrate-binding protein
MRRRDFIAALVVSSTVPRANAQQRAKVYRIAVVHPSQPVGDLSETGLPRYRAFFQRLRELGNIEGQNLAVERYSGEGRTEHFAQLAAEVIRSNPDLIFVPGSRLTLAIKAATETIPVVTVMSDPVAFGVVSSLARPGRNITGVTTDAGVDIRGKRFELLHEMAPAASRVAHLASRRVWEGPEGAVMPRSRSLILCRTKNAPHRTTGARHLGAGRKGSAATS